MLIGALNVERATAKIIQNLIAKYDTHVLKQGVARQHRAVRLNLADRVEGQTQKPTLDFLQLSTDKRSEATKMMKLFWPSIIIY
jgi:hypothetical protein